MTTERLLVVGGYHDGQRFTVDANSPWITIRRPVPAPAIWKPGDAPMIQDCSVYMTDTYQRQSWHGGQQDTRTVLVPMYQTPTQTFDRLLECYPKPLHDEYPDLFRAEYDGACGAWGIKTPDGRTVYNLLPSRGHAQEVATLMTHAYRMGKQAR